ncbi:hypothetical protein [Paludisphaera mucosa]|uniref:Uncharacterized protein n=1 Tax=Paludisphaera mucosa TaxID=3030827 RepID=A0ABT6FGI9_9BACT|nr:hypothetical protein [Paludisphaera mucosa]MDG3006684.1 hypothetical protein [Paludisphaera mucosa]
MRTRHAFRPSMESMPRLDLPSTIVVVDPLAPVMIPSQPTPVHVQPTDPVPIPSPGPYDVPYVGVDPSQPIHTDVNLTA